MSYATSPAPHKSSLFNVAEATAKAYDLMKEVAKKNLVVTDAFVCEAETGRIKSVITSTHGLRPQPVTGQYYYALVVFEK